MKIFSLFIFLLFLPHFLWASGFVCQKSVREMRMVVVEDQELLKIKITNPMGFEMMPLAEAPLSQFQIPFLKMQGDDLQELGSAFEIKWEKNKCSNADFKNLSITCQSQGSTTVANIKAASIKTFQITEASDGESIEYLKFRVMVEKEGNYYFLPFVFPKKNCQNL